MQWRTRVTDLLGCKYPILQGAYARLGTWQFAAAVARAGAHGTITGSVPGSISRLRDDIKRCKEAIGASGGTFGVNLSIGICPDIEGMVEVCIEEQVPVETSVYKPDALAPRIKAGGIKWIHKAARVKDAVHAVEVGADAIILVGLEGAGIKSPEQLPTMTNTIWGGKQIKKPLIAAGGFGDARGLLAALGMGADAIMMGTAFMLTKECPITEAAKQAMLKMRPDNPDLRQRVLIPGPPLPPRTASTPVVSDQGESTEYSRGVSFAVGVLEGIPSVGEFVENIMRDAEQIVNSWEFLKRK